MAEAGVSPEAAELSELALEGEDEEEEDVAGSSAAASVELPVVVDVLLFEVLVEVVAAAAFSAEVSVGGVISGVLLGIASATLPEPPQALSVTVPANSASATSARATAQLTSRAVPCAGHTSDSR